MALDTSEPEDGGFPEWPDWYGDLLEIKDKDGNPLFDEPPAKVDKWLAQQRISESQANKAASSLLAKWDGLKYTKPWPAFRNWAQIERDRPLSRNGGGTAVERKGYSWAWEGRR